MTVLRTALAFGVVGAVLTTAAPASAQFFLRSHDFSGAPVTGAESDIGVLLPGATETERRAGLVWNMRAALNVAALQCQFEPTLLTVSNYNAMLQDHEGELKNAFDTIAKFFTRTNATKKAGQNALDQFGTRIYSNYATVSAQYGFCQTAGSIGRDAIFAPRGKLIDVAIARTRELRNSLVPYGEQQLPRYLGRDYATMPRLDEICWNKKGDWQQKKCGVLAWPPAATTGLAAR